MNTSSITLADRVRDARDRLSPGERRVAQYLLAMPTEQLVFASAEELGRLTKTSDATVIRTARRLGYTGLPHLKRVAGEAMATTLPAQELLTRRLSRLRTEAPEMVARVFADAAESLALTAAAIDHGAVKAALEVLGRAQNVFAFGYGGSEPPARHLVRSLRRLGQPADVVGSTGFVLADDLIRIRRDDAVVVFQPARPLPDLEVVIDHAGALGAGVVLVSGESLAERYRERVDVSLLALRDPGELSAESLPAMVVADVLASGMGLLNEQRAVGTREQLTALRDRLSR